MQRLNSVFHPHTSSANTTLRSSTVVGGADHDDDDDNNDDNNAAAQMDSVSTRVTATTTTMTVNAGDIAPTGIQNHHDSASDAKEMRDVIFGHQSIDDQIHIMQPRSPFTVSDASTSSSSTSTPANRDETSTYLPHSTTAVSLNPNINQQQPLRQEQVLIHQPHTVNNDTTRNTHAPKLDSSTCNKIKKRSDIQDDEKQSVGMMDFLTFLFELRPYMIKFATHSQLLLALPLLLHRIAASHANQKASPLVEPLVMRLLACRKLKLRFLLMRHLDWVQSISVSLRFSSRAYQAPPSTWITTACSLSHMNVWAEPRPRAFVIPVDMVDLQSDDFFYNVAFFNLFKDGIGVGANVSVGDQALKKKGCGHWRQMGQQLICHPFQTCGKRYHCDDVNVGNASDYISFQGKNDVNGPVPSTFEESHIERWIVSERRDDFESEDDNDFEDVESLAENVDKENEFLGQFAFICDDDDDDDEPILEIRRICSNDNEIRIDKLESMMPQILLSEQEDMLRFQAVQMLFHIVNSVWKSPVYHCEDPMSAPFCATLDHIAISQMKGLIESISHTQPIGTFNVLGSSSAAGAAASSSSYLYSSKSDGANARGRNVWMDRLMRSAAGALTIGYVIGLQLRQGDELAIKDSNCIFWQKFPVVFDVSTCASTRTSRNSSTFVSGVTRLSIPKGLKSFFISHHMWDHFRKLCVAAFQTLRLAWFDVFPIVAPLFATAGISHQLVNHYVKSRASLFLKHKNSHRAVFQFRRWLS